jgi:hypothetical protein
MTPEPATALQGVAHALLSDLPPEIRSPFGKFVASVSGSVALVLAQELDRLVDRLVIENEATAAVLSDACPLLGADLADRVRLAVRDRTPRDLKVSTVRAINDALRALLIETHAEVERQDSPAAMAMNARIWAELSESVRRRAIDLPGL